MKFADGIIELNDIEVFHNCSYSCYMNIADALDRLKEYEEIGLSPDEIKYFLEDFGLKIIKENRKLKYAIENSSKTEINAVNRR